MPPPSPTSLWRNGDPPFPAPPFMELWSVGNIYYFATPSSTNIQYSITPWISRLTQDARRRFPPFRFVCYVLGVCHERSRRVVCFPDPRLSSETRSSEGGTHYPRPTGLPPATIRPVRTGWSLICNRRFPFTLYLRVLQIAVAVTSNQADLSTYTHIPFFLNQGSCL